MVQKQSDANEGCLGVPESTTCPYCSTTSSNSADIRHQYCGSCQEFYDYAGLDLHEMRERLPKYCEWWVTFGGVLVSQEESRVKQIEALRRKPDQGG